jgi:polyhydroxyalkanoate synthesis regulator phasin
MRVLFERSFLAGIGLLSMTHEKAQKIVDELTQRGEIQKEDVKDSVERLVQRGEEERQSLRMLIRDEVKSVLEEVDLATKQDFRDMTDRIDANNKQKEA